MLGRAGLLATLAHHNQSSPTLRGVFVREQLLCETLPPPPPSVNNTPSEPNAKQTTRERLLQHASDATCAGCHRLIDPIGLAFENFDGTGQWRDVESGKPIDASGEIVGGVGLEGRFTGVPDLARRLASSPQIRACVVRQWMRFAHGRAEAQEDGPLVAQLAQNLRDSGGDLRRTLVDLVGTPAFLSRRGGAR